MNNELKDCPFCGCKVEFNSNRDWHRVAGDHLPDCVFYDYGGAAMMVPANNDSKEWAINAWNRRTLAAPVASAAPSGEREKFEAWAKSKGLIQESGGIRSESWMLGVAEEAWKAAILTLEQNSGMAYALKEIIKNDPYKMHNSSIIAAAAIAHQPPKEALTDEQVLKLAADEGIDNVTDERRPDAPTIISFARAIEAASAPNKQLVAALKDIAAFKDETANFHLKQTGRYSGFDEPYSVKVARAALAAAGVKGE